MIVEIISPDKKIFEGEATSVHIPGVEGSFEMLNNHAPIISVLKPGKVKVVDNNDIQFFEIDGGVVEMNNNKVIILAE